MAGSKKFLLISVYQLEKLFLKEDSPHWQLTVSMCTMLIM